MTDAPNQPPSMLVLKVKVDATKLSFEPTMEELANYLAVRLMQEFTGADYAPRPLIQELGDFHGNTIGQIIVQDGKQPFPDV